MTIFRFNFNVVIDNLEYFLVGALISLGIGAAAVSAGLVIGTLGAVLKSSRWRGVRWTVSAYVELFRATPLLIQLYVVYFALPLVTGVFVDSMVAGLVGLALYSGAYLTEIIRAGVQSVPTGQRYAARALGFSEWQTFQHIVLPQATRAVMPPVGSQLIDSTLSTSLLAIIGGEELTQRATIVDAATLRPFEVYGFVGLVYLALTRVMVFGVTFLERRLSRRTAVRIARDELTVRVERVEPEAREQDIASLD